MDESSSGSEPWCADALRDAVALLDVDLAKGQAALNKAYKSALDDVVDYFELASVPRAEADLWSADYDPRADAVLIAALARSAAWWAEEERFTNCAGAICALEAFLEVAQRSSPRRPTMTAAIEAFQDLHDGDEDELEEFNQRLDALK